MVVFRVDNVEVEIDPISIVVSASEQLGRFRRRGIIRYLRGEIYLVSSNLFALRQWTQMEINDQRITAAPLVKPDPNGPTKLVSSGFSVTGIHDSFGQTELGSALARANRPFVMTSDSDPDIDKNQNLICFGSPSSNLVSHEIFDSLISVTSRCFRWSSNYDAFTLANTEYRGGNTGVVLFHDSPWNQNRKILVLSGIGPMGTLGCCKAAASWDQYAVSKKQRRSDSFLCALRFAKDRDELTGPDLLGFEEL